MKYILLFSSLALSLVLSGQEASVEELIANAPLVISEEKLEINIYGKENYPEAFQVRRKVRFKVLGKEGIEKVSHWTLPENLDPSFITHGPDVKNLGVYYSGYKVQFFNAKVFRKGKEVRSGLKERVREVESFNLDYLYEYDQYQYELSGVEVGDEVLIDYHIDIPFRENYSRFASYRIFFHADVPKLKYEFKLSHHKSLDFELYTYNGAEDVKAIERDRLFYYTWKMENLSPSMGEVNSRPYKELPHITWVINHYRYLVHNSNNFQNIPHYAIVAQLRSPQLFDILRSLEIGSRSQQFLPFSKTFDRLTEGQPEDFERLKHIHNHIARDFKYDNDIEYYRRNDLRSDRLGEFFENGIVRDHNRYDLYYAILVKADEQFYSSFLIDKRSGEISDSYFQPTFDNDFLLANYFGERSFDFIHPKRSGFGWFYNELPFYWEDCLTRLVHISDYAEYKMPIKDVFRSTRTHVTESEQNRRMIQSKVKVDIDEDRLSFKSKVLLSGQFSTLCRPVYMGFRIDPTVDRNYGKAVWKINGSRDMEVETIALMESHPYESEFYCTYDKVSGGMNAEGRIDISDWFRHVLPGPEEGHRYLTYYSDFEGEDIIEYYLEFPGPVQLTDDPSMELENEFARYSFTAVNSSPNVIRLTSDLLVKKNKVPPEDIDQVRNVIRRFASLDEIQVSY